MKKKNDDEKTKKLKVKAGRKSRTIKVDYLARVEGEGALYIKTKGNQVEDVQLKIFEPPRFFEAFIQGRDYLEAPDITSRICGICPVAYQMSAVTAMENALNIDVPESTHLLRRLLYCGEWIESHALHVVMLHLPDFMGYQDAIQMAKDHPQWVQEGLAQKKLGNQIVTLVGGREIHPINVRVGGFYKLPDIKNLQKLKESLKTGLDLSLEHLSRLSKLTFPDFTQDYEFISLLHPDEYPMSRGPLVSNKGLRFQVHQFEDNIEEMHVPYTHALHAKLKNGNNYFLGPLARFNLNFEKLPDFLQKEATKINLIPPVLNPFKSILARAIEISFAFYEAIRIIDAYTPPDEPYLQAPIKASGGYGCTEAPRGLLYHHYELDEQGLITHAKIIPPTSQNQLTIEKDLKHFVEKSIHLPDEELTFQCEQAIRNYDPCISCSTHFLKVHKIHED